MPVHDLRGQFLIARRDDTRALAEFAAAISAWEPRFEFARVPNPEFLGAESRTTYALLASGAAVLAIGGGAEEPMAEGDIAVVAPGMRARVIAGSGTRLNGWKGSDAIDAADFVIFTCAGQAPEHMAGGSGLEVHRLAEGARDRSICGARSQVIDAEDLRYRFQYHFVEIRGPMLHTHEEMVEFYCVLYGSGAISIGPSPERLERVAVEKGDLIAVGPGLYHPPDDGLGMAILFLYDEAAHERRLAERSRMAAAR